MPYNLTASKNLVRTIVICYTHLVSRRARNLDMQEIEGKGINKERNEEELREIGG